MKYLFLIWLVVLVASTAAQGQYITRPDGEYLDTTSTRNPACAEVPIVPFSSVEGKYPRSSETLAEQAQAFVIRKGRQYSGNGHITFRFIIDCQGRREPLTQVLQTDVRYRRAAFSPALVRELYAFLQTLTAWKVGKAQFPVRYMTFLNFKIHDGKVVAVTP